MVVGVGGVRLGFYLACFPFNDMYEVVPVLDILSVYLSVCLFGLEGNGRRDLHWREGRSVRTL
jgi:hypothetical protein